MTHELSVPLTGLPPFLSTISMVVDDQSEIIKSFVQAERKSPPVYSPAKELFCKVLQGGFRFDQALEQARRLGDQTERKCAIEILQASENFLRNESPARIGPFPAMSVPLPNGLGLEVSQVLIRHLHPERLLVLLFWKSALSPRQLSAAAAVLLSALRHEQPAYQNCEADFISVSSPGGATRRRFKRFGWADLKPLRDDELSRFWKPLCSAWSIYRSKEPRRIKTRGGATLFGER